MLSPHWGQARSSAVGRVAITAMRSFLRINGSPRKMASPTISGSAGESPCMSGHCGFGRLQPPATVCLCPARMRLRALGLELKRFQNAYGAPPPRLDGRIVGIGTPASLGPWIQGRVRCLRLRIPRTGPTGVLTDSAASPMVLDRHSQCKFTGPLSQIPLKPDSPDNSVKKILCFVLEFFSCNLPSNW